MEYDSTDLHPPVAEQELVTETHIPGEKGYKAVTMADPVAYLRDKIGRGEYEIDLMAIAAAMMAAGNRQKSD